MRPSAQIAFRAGSGLDLCALFFGLASLDSFLLFRLLGFGRLGDQPAPLADAGLAPDLSAQVVEAALAHVPMTQDVDLVYARRVDHERPLHADAVGHPADREIAPQAAACDADNGAFE